MAEIGRKTTKYGNEEERWVCVACGDVHFEDLCGLLNHLEVTHFHTEVRYNLLEDKIWSIP